MNKAKPSSDLIKAIAVTAELTGTELSPEAARVLAEDLARYPVGQVLGALNRARRELKGRMTLAEVISRLDDGRPGPEEAWAMLPTDEAQTVVWTDEMQKAWSVARHLMESSVTASRSDRRDGGAMMVIKERTGANVQARMAFLETYRAEVAKARDDGRPVNWTVSLGHDQQGRETALIDAVRQGRITQAHAVTIIPQLSVVMPESLGFHIKGMISDSRKE